MGGVDSGPRQRDGRGWITPAPGGLGHVFQAPLILAAMLRAPQKMLTWAEFPC